MVPRVSDWEDYISLIKGLRMLYTEVGAAGKMRSGGEDQCLYILYHCSRKLLEYRKGRIQVVGVPALTLRRAVTQCDKCDGFAPMPSHALCSLEPTGDRSLLSMYLWLPLILLSFLLLLWL